MIVYLIFCVCVKKTTSSRQWNDPIVVWTDLESVGLSFPEIVTSLKDIMIQYRIDNTLSYAIASQKRQFGHDTGNDHIALTLQL